MEFCSFEKKCVLGAYSFKKLKKLKNELETVWLEVQKAGVSVIVLLEGPGCCEKAEVMSKMVSIIDPRFFETWLIKKPSKLEKQMPQMWRFWVKTPEKGKIAFFYGSWYYELLSRNFNNAKTKLFKKHLKFIKNFETYLIANGTLIVKIYFKISAKQQHFSACEFNKKTFKRINQKESSNFAVNSILSKTSFLGSKWHVVSAESSCLKILNSLKILLNSLKQVQCGFALQTRLFQKKFSKLKFELCKPIRKKSAKIKLGLKNEKGFYEFNLKCLQFKLGFFQKVLLCKKIPLILLFEGTDAAGKGGAIKRVVNALDARFYRVVPIAAPSEVEFNHHYLWRFIKKLPAKGHFVVFDRSWYGRVLVEKVDELASIDDQKRAYGEINCFEKELVQGGAIVIKFWLQISKKEQLKRFEKRKRNINKAWKLTADDWKNRKKWNKYAVAVDEMFAKTSTKLVPWRLIKTNSKKEARLQILSQIVLEIQRRLKFGSKS